MFKLQALHGWVIIIYIFLFFSTITRFVSLDKPNYNFN